jgi:CubicO group peptidase (beta-lactamase class C family)
MTMDAVKSRDVVLQGYCSPKYEKLREAFLRNFCDHGEIGASYAVMVGGEMVADLWGGWKDEARTIPWDSDTIVSIWSTAKGIAGVCFAMLVDRGIASYDDKVSKYWPEFAAEGKGDVTIAMLLSHQAGIPGFTTPATLDDLLSGEKAAQRLAAQAPLWKPGTASGYHGMVIGVLATALFARIEGRSLKQFVADVLAGSFGLDISVGLEAKDRPRTSDLIGGEAVNALVIPLTNDAQRALHNPRMTGDLPNTPAFQAADLTSGNGFGNARALAQMYGLLLHPGKDGRPLASRETVAEASKCRISGIDLVRGIYTRWAAGFLLSDNGAFGPNKEAFGSSGWGGSFGFADPVADVAVGYAMNKMSDQMDLNPRRRGLIEAVYAAI